MGITTAAGAINPGVMAMGAALGSAGAAKLGASLAGGGGSSQAPYYTPSFVNQMNTMLNSSLNQAINSSTAYTNQGVSQLNTSNQAATDALKQYLASGTQAAQGAAQQGLFDYKTAQSPYANAGYAANDKLMQSLGLATPKGGSANSVQMQQMGAQLAPLLQSLKGQYTAGDAPTAPTLGATAAPELWNTTFDMNASQKQIQDALIANGRSRDNANRYASNLHGTLASNPDQLVNSLKKMGLTDSSLYTAGVNTLHNRSVQDQYAQQQQQAKQTYNGAMDQYNTQKGIFDTRSGTIGQVNSQLQGLTPQQRQQLAIQMRGLL